MYTPPAPSKGTGSLMQIAGNLRQAKMTVAVVVAMVAMVAASALPALAQTPFFVRCPITPTPITPPGKTFFIDCLTTDATGDALLLPAYNCQLGEPNPPGNPLQITCTQQGVPTASFSCVFQFTKAPAQLVNVYRCGGGEGPPAGPPGAAAPGAGGGPVSLETENEAESGAVDLSFGVSNEGDYASQCVPAEQFGNSGNFNNAPGFLQFGSGADDFEPGGTEFAAEPEQDVGCDSAVQQSAAASE